MRLGLLSAPKKNVDILYRNSRNLSLNINKCHPPRTSGYNTDTCTNDLTHFDHGTKARVQRGRNPDSVGIFC